MLLPIVTVIPSTLPSSGMLNSKLVHLSMFDSIEPLLQSSVTPETLLSSSFALLTSCHDTSPVPSVLSSATVPGNSSLYPDAPEGEGLLLILVDGLILILKDGLTLDDGLLLILDDGL